MQSLNPFLRAFFKSSLVGQCNPVNSHILLVPTTEVLLTSRDRETDTPYAELAGSDDFLASHVLRIQSPPSTNNVRDSRGKAKQFTTFNNRTVVVKESFVYSNKGFKNLNQAQLLSDALYYPNSLDAQQWLIYYISRPLIGSLEPIKITSAILPDIYNQAKRSSNDETRASKAASETATSSAQTNRDIKTFNDLLNSFPMIARQMQSGLKRVLKEFNEEIKSRAGGRSSPGLSRRHSGASSHSGSNGSIHSRYSNGHVRPPSIATLHVEEEEEHMRRGLETAVTAAIDLFQLVDKQQLSYLGSSTDLTGPMVERLIERYVAEQLHDSTLFPLLRDSRKLEDLELESRIHQMQHVDISQVGISIEDGRHGKEQLMRRIRRGVDEFRKLGMAGSAQEMMDILLSTQKILSGSEPPSGDHSTAGGIRTSLDEKPQPSSTMNADTLVSLLLIVVIRSQVRHLQARLTYMRGFIFIDDVEGGEMGYALSTFEAVLSYLATDSGGLRKASRRNKSLWQAAKSGKLQELKAIIEPTCAPSRHQSLAPDSKSLGLTHETRDANACANDVADSFERPTFERRFSEASTAQECLPEYSSLAHVFPFQTPIDAENSNAPLKKSKRVSMDMRSLSNSSEYSMLSRSNTIDSRTSAIEGDTSIATLMQTQDTQGNSLLMMAVDSREPSVLGYLLSLEEHFPLKVVFQDSNNEGTTLLSAAVQLANPELIEEILQCLLQIRESQELSDYLNRADNRGRTVAHYLFNAPYLIPRLGELLPWREKDKNGQTPLLALCRSYDHAEYLDMVNDALHFATLQQGDSQPLHLDDHIDGKGNTILHVINNPSIAMRILRHCDSDANAANDKKFTPLMVASKYGRTNMVRTFFGDQRVDIAAKELRGLTAVELAKDDEVRNRIDDMVLVSNIPAADGRVTSVVRSFFVEDASIRLIIKSAVRNDNGMIGVTTCRRSLADFENLAKWLSVEHPASWLPSIFNFRSPFQVPSKPSRAALQDIQVRLDRFLKIMLSHSTFSTHELLWEFVLFPEIQPDMMAERSRKKAEIRSENIRDEYEPIDDVRDVEQFVGYARETLRPVHHATKSVIRRLTSIQNTSNDFSTALDISVDVLKTFTFLASSHVEAFTRYAAYSHIPESDPIKTLHQDFHAILSTIMAILSSLSRPHSLITSLGNIRKAIDRHTSSLRRSDRWPLGLLDETRKGIHADAQEKAQKSTEEFRTVSCELRYTQQTVASELAEWQELHAKLGRRAIRQLAQRMVVRQKDQLDNMNRAMRGLIGADKR